MRWSQPTLTAAQQYHFLKRNPLGGLGQLGPGRLTWRFLGTPSVMSRSYSLRMEFRQRETPRVFVDAPDVVVLAGGRRLPHVYEQKPTKLCLFLPRSGEWTHGMRLDQTILPWSVLWLYYFEEWLVSDDWKGGGVHFGEKGPETR